MIKLVLVGGEPSHSSKRVQIEIILIVGEKISVCWKKALLFLDVGTYISIFCYSIDS